MVLHRVAPQLVETGGLRACEVTIGHVGVRRTAPQRERLLEAGRTACGIGAEAATCVGGELLETRRVEMLRGDMEAVPAGLGRQLGAGVDAAVVGEQPPEPGDVGLHGTRRVGRLVVLPEGVGDPSDRDRLARVDQQQGQNDPLALAHAQHGAVSADRLDRAQHAEAQPHVWPHR